MKEFDDITEAAIEHRNGTSHHLELWDLQMRVKSGRPLIWEFTLTSS